MWEATKMGNPMDKDSILGVMERSMLAVSKMD